MSNDQVVSALLERVKTIALVGASDKPYRDSYRVMAYLLDQGYDVFPVNPNCVGKEILGRSVYSSVAEIGQSVDMVDIFRNSEAAADAVDEAISCQAEAIWMQLGVINHEAAQRARDAGLEVIMNSCPKMDIPRLAVRTPRLQAY